MKSKKQLEKQSNQNQENPNEKVDFVTFVYIYAKHVERYDHFPDLHIRMADFLTNTTDKSYRLLQVYRHAGKSWITSLYIAWRLYADPTYTCVIVSDSSRIASRNSRYIRGVIEKHPLTADMVDTKQWQTHTFSIKRPADGLNPSVTSTSMRSSFTGLHADEIICDDIEVKDNCKTEEGREEIKQGVLELTSLADHILFIGTPHHEDTIYNHIRFEMEAETLQIPVITEKGKLAWPEHHDGDWVKQKQQQNTTGRWKSQYLLVPAKAYETLIDVENVITYDSDITLDRFAVQETMRGYENTYYLNGERVLDIRAYWDPATGLQARDNSVVSCCIKTETGNVYLHDLEVLPAVSKDTGFEPQMKAVLEFCKRNFVNVIHVESNFQITLSTELKNYASRNQGRFRVKKATRTSRQNKEIFIADNIEPLIQVGRLLVHEQVRDETPFMKELEDFPSSKKDDCLDATAGAIAELTNTKVRHADRDYAPGFNRVPEPIVINNR